MTNKEKETLALRLYVRSNMTQEEIAKRVGWSRTTLWKHIKEGGWEGIKETRTITRVQLLQDAYNQLKAINKKIEDELQGIPNKELSDAKAIIRKEIETLSDNPLYIYIEVIDELTAWLQKNHPKKLVEFTEINFEFIEEISRKNGL